MISWDSVPVHCLPTTWFQRMHFRQIHLLVLNSIIYKQHFPACWNQKYNSWFFFVISGVAQQQQQPQQQQTLTRANDACQAKAGLLPHESFCDKYYICEDGLTDVRDCPNGLVWIGRGRGLKDGCGYPWDADCTNRPNRSKWNIFKSHCKRN